MFRAVMLKYAEKRLHFGYDSMRARSQLAVLDHNSNVGSPRATTQQGMIEHNVLDEILIEDHNMVIFGFGKVINVFYRLAVPCSMPFFVIEGNCIHCDSHSQFL